MNGQPDKRSYLRRAMPPASMFLGLALWAGLSLYAMMLDARHVAERVGL